MINKMTRQIMLYQLGYYSGKIDGIWGVKSKKATSLFQADNKLVVDSIYGNKTNSCLKKVYQAFMTGNMSDEDYKNIKYFTKKELECKCKCGYKDVSKQLIYNIDTLRYYLDTPIYVTSCCRCIEHNRNVGGSILSRHYNNGKGSKAIDLYTTNSKYIDYRKKVIDFWIKYMPNSRYGYCNGYSNNLGKKGSTSVLSMGNSIHLDLK